MNNIITSKSFQVEIKWSEKLRGKDLEANSSALRMPEALNLLHRKIEEQYLDLPWPCHIKRVSIVTEAPGGKGDVSAAGKVIKLMQESCPSLEFDWAVVSGQVEPQPFLKCPDPYKVTITTKGKNSQLLITGPAKCTWGRGYIERIIRAKIDGPRFDFLEAGSKNNTEWMFTYYAVKEVKENSQTHQVQDIYDSVHQYIFPTVGMPICMGVKPGTGIFFDPSRISASFSREYCCPSYLSKIEDASLRKDILNACGSPDDKVLPDYDRYSMNSGYAHRPPSWGKFVDAVALHEKEKQVVIVMNQHGYLNRPGIQEYCKIVFTPERIALLKRLGYGVIKVKGSDEEIKVLNDPSNDSSRTFTMILRPSFNPEDLKYLQLASERLIATGMNTPAESWAARCKLYLYEDVANGGVTDKFLKQQIKIAHTLDPKLGKLLELTGKNLGDLTQEQIGELEELLQNPEIANSTLAFCNHMVDNYRFEAIFLANLKRLMWHHYIPQLSKIESKILDDSFKEKVIKMLGSFEHNEELIEIHSLPLLAQRVKDAVAEYLNKNHDS